MERDSKSPVTFITMGIAGLFLAGFFLLVIFGAQTYRSIVEGQTGNNHTRELLGYLATCAKANDSRGAVSVSEGEGGQVLVIADGSSGYALRIYRYQGTLVEDYGRLESELDPEEAMVIGETEVFRIEQWPEGIYEVITDEGSVLFYGRSADL